MDSEKLKIGIRINPKKESPKHPTFYFYMKKLNSDDFVDLNPGALWLDVGKECPEDKKTAAHDLMQKLTGAIGAKWLKITGNLEVEAVYEALGQAGPPASSTKEPEDDLPF